MLRAENCGAATWTISVFLTARFRPATRSFMKYTVTVWYGGRYLWQSTASNYRNVVRY